MNEIIQAIYSYVRALWRRRWLALIVAWTVALLGWGYVLTMPNRYEASARVFVDARTALRPVLKDIAIDEDYESQLSLVREALLSRPQLEAVARKTNLDKDVSTTESLDRLITVLQKQIRVESIAAGSQRQQNQNPDTIYTIAYQHGSREKAVEVVRTLLSNFQEGTLSGNRSGTTEAQRFLSAQIVDLEKRLGEAEERLADFKKRNIGMIPGDRGDYFTRLNQEMSGLQQAETNLAVAMSRRSELQKQLASAKAYLPGAGGTVGTVAGSAPDVSQRRQEAEQKLEELLLRFTEKHPEVIALKQTIDELKSRESKEIAELQRGGAGSGALRSLSVNPVYQQIQSQLNQVQVEIASVQGAATQHRNEIANLRKFVDQAPEIEQEYARLNRDYGATKEQYEQLVQRREQARVSDDAARTGIVRFETIEPPRADLEPVAPRRSILFVAVLFAAIAAGVAASLLPYLLAPTFDTTSAVEHKLGVPVFGSVSAVRQPLVRSHERVDARRIVFACAALVFVALVLVIFGGAGSQFVRGLLA
ncbi:MAG: hypothetical protein EOP08_01740 [Proteobacteria bacterium]|nr:MAG: hypothetical protein EOP08_01740 [Pseudomonadota bacterium]